MAHRSGFVNIIGKPNVGKSTLLNALIGEELCIVTPRAQTTRHRIRAILNSKDHQVIFSDTPGVIEPAYKLHERMMSSIREALEDADLVLYVVELKERHADTTIAGLLNGIKIPVVIVINKVDQGNQDLLEEAVGVWKDRINPALIVPVSALHGFQIDQLRKEIIRMMPEAPAYFEKDELLSDRDVRFFVSEIIRGKILLQYRKEVPYHCEVKVISYQEGDSLDRISAVIFVSRESQKAILLGHGGKSIKQLGIASREAIEAFIGRRVHLELTVKVMGDWRDNENALTRFGYSG